MSADKELLMMAAKAAGISGEFDGLTESFVPDDGFIPSSHQFYWNPLKSDGDALRLAVKLKLCVSIEFDRVDVTTPQMDNATEYFYDNPPTDPYAATRRAVVRAAAAIGKEMKA